MADDYIILHSRVSSDRHANIYKTIKVDFFFFHVILRTRIHNGKSVEQKTFLIVNLVLSVCVTYLEIPFELLPPSFVIVVINLEQKAVFNAVFFSLCSLPPLRYDEQQRRRRQPISKHFIYITN